ncbi:MAG: M42 family metallopeptidase [Bdellovibrionales bacterium]|nr:M42 family metallopeptidase [Bdellovibrionales bacterium]
MRKDARDFLHSLLTTPSPSGFEPAIQRVVKKRIQASADSVTVDVHGNLIAALNPEGPVRVMLAGHCDQIGMMITHIDDHGYLWFQQIGGLDPSVLPGTEVIVLTPNGRVPGVLGQKAVHLKTQAERGQKTELKKLWIDIGAADGKAAKKLVSVGDVAVFAPRVTALADHRISAAGCDDRVGVFVVMEAFRLVAEALKKRGKSSSFPVALFAVSTVQEELGLRGARTAAYGIDPLVGIAVDVTHSSDNPGGEAKQTGTVKLGEGPTIARGANMNPELETLLRDTAKAKRIPFQPLGVAGATGTDANAMQINRKGVAAALVGVPNRYMHTPVEVVDIRDLEAASKLIAETVLKITKRMTFVPV